MTIYQFQEGECLTNKNRRDFNLKFEGNKG